MKMSCQLTSVVSWDCNKDIPLANNQLCPGTADEDVLSANISCVLGL